MKEYSESLLFDNGKEGGSVSELSLEAVIRSAAQRMLQGAAEAEAGGVFAATAGSEIERGGRVSGVSERASSAAGGDDRRWAVDAGGSRGYRRFLKRSASLNQSWSGRTSEGVKAWMLCFRGFLSRGLQPGILSLL